MAGMYAVAVRDDQLYLILRVRRSPKGEVFVMFPREDPDWDPHSSIHIDGTHHQKSFDHKFHVQVGDKPTVEPKETRNVVTTGVAAGEARVINAPCKANEFSDVFEIPEVMLRPEKYRTHISVDLTSPGGTPIIPHGARILQQHVVNEVVPWIVITLFETS
jgi:hypothetical protein